MPTVPSYGGRKVGIQDLPAVRKSGPAFAPETMASQGGAVNAALENLGAVGARVGLGIVDQISKQQRATADATAALTYGRELDDLTHDLMTNPDHGALSVTGKAAVEQYAGVLEKYDAASSKIADSLTNERQKADYANKRDTQRGQIMRSLDAHGGRELERYQKGEAEAAVATMVEKARLNSGDPAIVTAQLGRIDAVVAEHASALGISGPEAAAAYKASLKSSVWEAAIAQSIADGNNRQAKVYLEEARDAGQISGDALTKMTAATKRASTDAEGEQSAAAIWMKLGPSPLDDTTAISIDRLEAAAREQYQNDPDGLAATIRALRTRAEGVNAGRRERAGVTDNKIWGAVFQGKAFADVARDPAFIAADGDFQLKVRDYYNREAEHLDNLEYRAEARANARESRAAGADAREAAADARRERALTISSFAKYQELTTPEALRDLAKLPPEVRAGEILRDLPILGHVNTTKLLQELEQRTKDDATLSASKADTDLFNTAAAAAGVVVDFGTGGKTKEKDQRKVDKAIYGQLKQAVDEEVGRMAKAKTAPLTPDEQRTAAQTVIDRHVLLRGTGAAGGWFSSATEDTDRIAAVVNAEDRAKAYVPIAKVPADVSEAYAAELRKTLGPKYVDWTAAALRASFPTRFERAFAVHLMGGKNAEVRAALSGAP